MTADDDKHKRRVEWFWSVVGGLCALVFVFAISSWIGNVHIEWMKCYEVKRNNCSR